MNNPTNLCDAFWEALKAQARNRDHVLTPFDKQVAGTILEAGLKALEDYACEIPQYRVVSAPTGSGKSSYAFALIKALIDAIDGSSAVFLCETIDQCEDTYKELSKLLEPSDLAIWSSSHDKKRTLEEVEADDGFVPSAQFLVDDLSRHRVIVVTHAFYKGTRGVRARRYGGGNRTLTIVDERPKEVSIYDIDQGDVSKARDWASNNFGSESEAVAAFKALHTYLGEAWESEGSANYRALRWSESEWFNSSEAHGVLIESSESTPGKVIGFAQALRRGYAFMSRFERGTKGGRFVGYKMDLPLFPGTVLLDATSDIDGVSQLVSWRSPVASPKVSYENLTVTHITPPTDVIGPRDRVSEIVRTAQRAKPYAAWIKEVVIKNTDLGEKVLVVVHKALLDHEYLPNQDSLGEGAIDLDGRKVAFINWGYGIGSNRWKEATSVFLFGEFHIPKRATVGQVLGLLDHPAGTPRLPKLQSPNTQDDAFLLLQHGHLLRWEKQLAMRGNARNLTPEGACGEQKLFVTSEFKRFFQYRERLFPDARFVFEATRTTDKAKRGGCEGLVRLLLTSEEAILTSHDVRLRTDVNLSKHAARMLSDPLVKEALAAGGWTYVSGGGRGNPSRFQRALVESHQEIAHT